MKLRNLLVVLLLCSPLAYAEETFTDLELRGWKEFCKTELNGDAALCSCLKVLQSKNVDTKTLKINYSIMAMEALSLDAGEINELADTVDDLTNKSEAAQEKAMDIYFDALEKNMAVCEGG